LVALGSSTGGPDSKEYDMKVKQLVEWLAQKDPETDVEVEISVFPDERCGSGYLEVVPLVEGMEGDGPETAGLAVDLHMYDPNAEQVSEDERIVSEYLDHLREVRAEAGNYREKHGIDRTLDLTGIHLAWAHTVKFLAAELGIESRTCCLLYADCWPCDGHAA
jgi:hypothetical protein